MSAVLLLNGPNLGLLGHRIPEIYGRKTLAEVEADVRSLCEADGHELLCLQSNHEGVLVDFLNTNYLSTERGERDVVGIILNPGALTHTSIALRDALEMFAARGNVFVFEVHISNVFAREPFRHESFISGVATGVVCGLGTFGYVAAAMAILNLFKADK